MMSTIVLPEGRLRYVHVLVSALKTRFAGESTTNPLCCVRDVENLAHYSLFRKVEFLDCENPPALQEVDPLPGTDGKGICVMVTDGRLRCHVSTDFKIKAAAIRTKEGAVFSVERPGRHHDIFASMAASGFPKPIGGIQGFITEDDRFVNRDEALVIAESNDQVRNKSGNKSILYSEDMW